MELSELFITLDMQPLQRDGSLSERLYSSLYYATKLLRLLRKNRDEYRVLRFKIEEQRFVKDLAEPLERPVGAFFAGGMMPNRSPEEHTRALEPLYNELRALEQWEHNQPLLLARAVAYAIHKTVLSSPDLVQFRNYYSVLRPEQIADPACTEHPATVQPGDPVPTCFGVFGRHEMVETARRTSSFGTNPTNLPAFRNPDRLPSIVLAPLSVASFDLRLDFDYDHELKNIQYGDSTVIATFHPTKNLFVDFSHRPLGEHGERFFDVRARCGDDVEPTERDDLGPPPFESRRSLQERISHGIREAAKQGANLFLLPELVLKETDAQSIFETWRAVVEQAYRDESNAYLRPQIMIPGSWHGIEKPGGARVNTAEVWGGRKQVNEDEPRGAKVHKTVPYAHRIDRHTTDERTNVEDINVPRRPPLTVFCAENATMMILVCVDFLLDELRDLVRDLYVSLVVVPSMSGKSRVFNELMIGHVASTEAVTIFLNALEPADDPHRTVMMVRHPDQQSCVAINHDSVPELATHRGVVLTDIAGDARHGLAFVPI